MFPSGTSARSEKYRSIWHTKISVIFGRVGRALNLAFSKPDMYLRVLNAVNGSELTIRFPDYPSIDPDIRQRYAHEYYVL